MNPSYRNLKVWQKAHRNSVALIDLFKKNGVSIKFNRIIDDSVGAITSIGANIAEGNEYGKGKEKSRYFKIALRSAYELDNWLQVLIDSGLLKDKETLREIEKRNLEVIKILITLTK